MRTILLLLAAVALGAQTSPNTLPTDVVMAGGAYARGGTPPVAGWATYAKLVSASAQAYSFSTYQSSLVAGKVQTSTTTGFATVVKQLGPLYALVYGQAGVASSTDATTGAFAGGGFGVLRLGKTSWVLCGGYETLKGTSTSRGVIKFGIGRTK